MKKLCIPEEILNQHSVALGKTGAGKSSLLRYLAEHLLSQKKRICIIDPKGDHWGLKFSADGKEKSGFPIRTFGDFKESKATDIALNRKSGKYVAELLTEGNRPSIIGFRGWSPSDMREFWIDFASTLFNTNASEIYLMIDEVHNFAPKGKILDPKSGEMLHWTNRVLSEGRGLGLVCIIASQRPQKVHNDTLTCCETLIAMKVTHASDRQAVKDWIDGCGDKEQGRIVLDTLAQMAKGEAYVWSPEIGFGPERIQFPKFSTFDSFAPPQLQPKVHTKDWSSVDLEKENEKLASIIEEVKANDPIELKKAVAEKNKKISDLEKQLAAKPGPPVATAPVIDEEQIKGIIIDTQEKERKRFEAILSDIGKLADRADAWVTELPQKFPGIAGRVKDIIDKEKAFVPEVRVPKLKSIKAPVVSHNPGPEIRSTQISVSSGIASDASLGKGSLRNILITLAQNPEGLSDKQIGLNLALRPSTGTFKNYLSKARMSGWIIGSRDHMRITEEGLIALGDYEPLPTGHELFKYWRTKLGGGSILKVFDTIVGAWPDRISSEQIGQETELLPTTGTFKNYISQLRTLNLIEGKGDSLRASDKLFG